MIKNKRWQKINMTGRFFVCVGVMYSGEYQMFVMLLWMWLALRVTSQTSYSPEYITPTHTKKSHILEYIDIEGTLDSVPKYHQLEPTWPCS
jgi:hypothetical protein